MTPKGSPRDMNKWRATLRDPNITFPGESSEYRRARKQLLQDEDELRRLNEQVAAKRRALPAGGLLAEDYVFESAVDGSEVRFSDLFAPRQDHPHKYNNRRLHSQLDYVPPEEYEAAYYARTHGS